MKIFAALIVILTLLTSCLEHNSLAPTDKITSLNYARLKTLQGDVVFKFLPNVAPHTTERVKHLISQGFYNGLRFHKVIANSVVQTGDPVGDGTGGSGQLLKAEISDLDQLEGTVAMARNISDMNSADSQFFFNLKDNPKFNGNYTIFAKVVNGMDVLKKITQGDKIILLILE